MLEELFLMRRSDADAVEHGVDGDVGKALLFLERDAELLESLQDLRIDFIESGQGRLHLGLREVDDVLIIDSGIMDMGPARLLHRQPFFESLESEVEQKG